MSKKRLIKDEATMKNEKLAIDLEQAELNLRKAQREERKTLAGARLDTRQKRAIVERAEADALTAKNAAAKSALDLAAAQRRDAQDRASDASNGEYTFLEGVNNQTVKEAIAALNVVSRLNPNSPITVTLNSPGGSVIAGLGLYDHLRELSARGHHITVKVRGMAASMGGILLQAGDTRIVGPEALVLIHEVASGTQGKVSEMQDDVNFSRKLWDKLAVILSKRSTMTPEQIKDTAHKFDWWLDAEEAVKLGFADQIG